jgi:hypothetical protein
VIDWLSTKVAMSLAALILLAGVVAFFLAAQQEARHDALQSIADRAAGILDEVSRTKGEMNITISVGPGGTQELPGQAGGEPYSLTLYPSYVVAGFDGERAFAVLHTPVHLWEPRAGAYTAARVADLDTRHPSLSIGSGGTVVVVRRYLMLDGSPTLETFAFL